MTRLIDWAIAHPAYAIPALTAAGAVALLALYCLIGAVWDAIDQRRVRRGIRRLEDYANHPGAHAVHTDQPREEEQP